MSTLGSSDIPSYRSINALGFLISAAALAVITLYIEPVINLQQCTLCTLVRLTLVFFAGTFLLGFLINRVMFIQRLFAVINLTLIVSMLVTLVRHILAVEKINASCTIPATGLFNSQPPLDALMISLNNAVYCPKLQWHFYDLSFAHLALAVFIILLAVVWRILVKKPQPKLLF